MQHSEGKFIAADGLAIYYQTWRADGGPQAAILIVHGLGEHSSRYQNYVDYFVPKGYALYSFDLRGHGQSDGPRGYVDRFDRYVDDVSRMVRLVREQTPSARLFMLGHSLGSLIGLAYALRYPDELAGVIATGTAMKDALALPAWKRALARVLSGVAPVTKFDNGVLSQYLSHDEAVVEAYDHDPLVHRIGTPRLATEVDAIRAMLYTRAGEWRVPLLMLHGSADRICLPAGARLFQAKTPPGVAEYRQYDGLYHEIHNETGRQAVFQDIDSWLRRQIS